LKSGVVNAVAVAVSDKNHVLELLCEQHSAQLVVVAVRKLDERAEMKLISDATPLYTYWNLRVETGVAVSR
jgi:hypothetical protein